MAEQKVTVCAYNHFFLYMQKVRIHPLFALSDLFQCLYADINTAWMYKMYLI